jgi:alkylation response protein AidB-like acyl-CoA dehydrogenase
MNFDYSDDEKMLKEQLRRLLGSVADRKAARRVLDGDNTLPRALWRKIGSEGWLSAALPAAYGGQGMGQVALCALAEEFGRALSPVPLPSITLVAEAIASFGSAAQKEKYLPALGRGENIGAFAAAEGLGDFAENMIKTTFASGKLTGTKIAVVDGLSADFALVAARASDGVSLYIVDLSAPEVTREPQKSIDPTRPVGQIAFEGAAAEPLGDGVGWKGIQKILDRAAVLIAFEQLGGADAALTMARDYALERHAFGRPIGGFQAIKHKLADVYIANELARSNAYYGAWALATGSPDLPLAAATARTSATEAFDRAARELIQVHGGIAITWEHDAQFFYRRARHLALALGTPAQWRKRLVQQLAASEAA